MLFGPPAVGKTTIGQCLAETTNFTLLHSHMIIDIVTEFFPFGSERFWTLLGEFHNRIQEEMAAEGRNLITTNIWNFENSTDAEHVETMLQRVRARGGEMFFVELNAPLDDRLERNSTVNRIRSKKTDWATPGYLQEWDEIHENASMGRFPYPNQHLVLDTTKYSAIEAASRIKRFFMLEN